LQGLAAGSGPCQLLLDFGNVERLSSAVLGQVVALERAVRRAGGKMVVCGVRPDLSDVLIITRLAKYLDLYHREEEGLQSLL